MNESPAPNQSASSGMSTLDMGVGATLKALLKHPDQIVVQLQHDKKGRLITSLLFITIACLAGYGIVVGSFSGAEQLWAAPVKVTLGTFLSAFMCLPSLFIFSCFSGVDVKFSETRGLLYAMLTLNSILLIGFAPVAWIFSQSTESLVFMGTLHLVFWSVGIWYGLRILYHGLRDINAGNRGHLDVWGFIFVMVALQMSTALRPIVGTSETFLPVEKKFFLAHWADCMRPNN